jgi:hypothetical protein
MVPPVASLNARDRRTIRKTLGLCARNVAPDWIYGRGCEGPQLFFRVSASRRPKLRGSAAKLHASVAFTELRATAFIIENT